MKAQTDWQCVSGTAHVVEACSTVCNTQAVAVMAGAGSTDIILLGERTLVVLSDQGRLRWQKRFDYQPVAFTIYSVSLLTVIEQFVDYIVVTTFSAALLCG